MKWFKCSINEINSEAMAVLESRFDRAEAFGYWMMTMSYFAMKGGVIDDIELYSFYMRVDKDISEEVFNLCIRAGAIIEEDDGTYVIPDVRDDYLEYMDGVERRRETQRIYREKTKAVSSTPKKEAPKRPVAKVYVVETTDDPIEDEIPLPDSVEEEVAVEVDPDDTQTKIETLEIATEIYDYYRDNVRGGKRKDTIDRIQRLLLGTHFADEKRVYTADELYGIIDNYLKLYDGSRDSMYTPERMFGRDAFFKMYLPGAIGAEEGLAALEVEHKAKEQAVELYNYYTSYIRKNGTTTYSKTQAIARIQDIILGRAPKLERSYSADEIRRATDNYRFEKSNIEEKYRATANNFFGGEKFYIKDFLIKAEDSKPKVSLSGGVSPKAVVSEETRRIRELVSKQTDVTEPIDLSALLREEEEKGKAQANQQ